MSETYGAERGLSRFEGFTDAVFAIALTLLIVEIKPPGAPDGHPAEPDLIHAVMAQWREHLALVLCFAASAYIGFSITLPGVSIGRAITSSV